MSAVPLAIGHRIELNDGRIATVRFVGPTAFQIGEWVGAELDEATGKNDGAVKGQRYFECEQGFGIFLRRSGVRQVVEEEADTALRVAESTAGNGMPVKSARPSSVHVAVNGIKRQSLAEGPGRRTSALGSSPTPGSRPGSGFRSPAKSPTKQLGSSNGVSSTSTSRTNTPPVGRRPTAGATALKPQPNLVPPTSILASARRNSALPGVTPGAPQRAPRPSLGVPTSGSKPFSAREAPVRTLPSPSAHLGGPAVGQRMGSTTEETEDDDASERPRLLSPGDNKSSTRSQSEVDERHDDQDLTAKLNFAPPPVPPDPPPQSGRSRRPSSPGAASVHSQRTMRSTTASNRQIEELEAKLRLLERKRQEDRGIKKTLEQAQQERDQYRSIIEKLQNKYRPQHQELADLKQALGEAEKRAADVEVMQLEHDSAMELVTLDREMAEEKAEGLQAELETIRARSEEMELELEILRDENADLSKEMSPDERNTAGWAQMEKSNERLREALLRLRDVMQDREAEYKAELSSLQNQTKEYESTRSLLEETKEKLLRSEADTADLRAQLEVALESEEMIEELTARNGRLDEAVSQLRTTIEELEEMKEVSDELEVSHVESEKQLQEEIDFKDSLLIDRERSAKQQQEALDEADYTITRYRALVSQMQSDLADMQASKQVSETEAVELSTKSRAMLDLNMKLQSSAAKTQVKTLDLELRKLEAQEASEHLAIVQLFLPDAFHAERDSVLALLRFKRVGFKANLVHSFVKERVATFGTRGHDEDVFAACDALDKLTWISAMADRFANVICGCDPRDFASFGGALYELEPIERALNGYIDGLRRAELNEQDMADELQRSMAVLSHLAYLHLDVNDLASHADELIARTFFLQSQLDSMASALNITKALMAGNTTASAEDDEDDDGAQSAWHFLLDRAGALISHARSAKVTAGKSHRALVDLQARSLTLEMACNASFDDAEAIAAEVSAYARDCGIALKMLVDEEGRSQPLLPSEIVSVLSRTAAAAFKLQDPEPGPLSALASRMRELTDLLTEVASLPADLDNTVEFERPPAPWVARANELKKTKLTSIDTETELKRCLESLRAKEVVLAGKETELEEQSVRIEMLEARMREAGKRSARIGELERALHDAKDGEKRASLALSRAREDKDREIARVRDEISRAADERRKARDGNPLEDGAMGAGAVAEMKMREHKILGLEGAVRYLHRENHRLRLPGPDSPLSARAKLGWLSEPLIRPRDESRQRRDALHREGVDVLQHLLLLAERKQPVDLTKMPENRLTWRPVKETSRWQIEARKEEWEDWREWRRAVVREASGRPVHVANMLSNGSGG